MLTPNNCLGPSDALTDASNRRGTDATTEPDALLARLLEGLTGHQQGVPNGTEGPLQDYIPFPFLFGADGISREKDDSPPEQVCGPIVIQRLTRGATGHDFGLLIAGITLDDRVISLSIPASRLHGDPSDLARVLADRGIRVVPSKEKALISYLDAARLLARQRGWLTAQPRLGWAEGSRAAFVFPEQVVGVQDSVFQPERANRMSESCRASGTLAEWQRRIALPAGEDRLATFALCASFVAPLLRPANSDSFGFNLYGLTSRGKTTLLQLVASVWGHGGDPGADGLAFCRRWNATGNALESLAEEHNDLPLPLDELGTFRNPAELGRAIYNLAGGRGAERLKSDSQRRTPRNWRTLILSSGEISLGELMQQNGQHQKGGQAVRIFDIPLPAAGLFAGHALVGQKIRGLKQAASECYGVAGRAFIDWLVGEFADHHAMGQAIRARLLSRTDTFDESSPEITRAAQRFILVEIAGELAAEAGVLPYDPQAIKAAVRAVWATWRATIPEVDDGKRAIRAIGEFIATHPGQFPLATDVDRLPHSVAGYYKENQETGDLYLFTETGLSAALGDISKAAALSALEDAGLLYKNDSKRKKSKHFVRALGKTGRMYFYAIRASGVDPSRKNGGLAVSNGIFDTGRDGDEDTSSAAPNVPNVSDDDGGDVF
ncbi:DUF927 domain-containing protein [Imbroritus primus]|uniref:DUF927 domain-containing protein n=1 Tax=Imbroritus primus TaxID=3058603 RepID=A0ACD3SQF4_9BURK|nr:DUF927 domain-containing protein [Burkholderiaceae bacterium PBA]